MQDWEHSYICCYLSFLVERPAFIHQHFSIIFESVFVCWTSPPAGWTVALVGGVEARLVPLVLSWRIVTVDPRTSTCRPVKSLSSQTAATFWRCPSDLAFEDAAVSFPVHDVPERGAAGLGGRGAACGGPAALWGVLGGHQQRSDHMKWCFNNPKEMKCLNSCMIPSVEGLHPKNCKLYSENMDLFRHAQPFHFKYLNKVFWNQSQYRKCSGTSF